MKILSIRQPWAWAIIHAGKDVENRSWTTKVRGRVLIHAGIYAPKQGDVDEFNKTFICAIPDEEARRRICPRWTEALAFERGGIVGSVEIVGCISESTSPWFFGPYGFVLRDPRPLPFVRLHTRLGFFDAPPEVMDQLRGDNP